jgi:hypothetical protein
MLILHLGPKGRPLPSSVVTLRRRYRAVPSLHEVNAVDSSFSQLQIPSNVAVAGTPGLVPMALPQPFLAHAPSTSIFCTALMCSYMLILHLGPKGRPLPSSVVTLRRRYRAVPSLHEVNAVTPGIPMALRLRPPGPACLNLPAGFAALPAAPRRSSLQILDKRCPSAKC